MESRDVTSDFTDLYHPSCALVFFETKGKSKRGYCEYYDIDKNGRPINAHPLTVNEADRLAKALQVNNHRTFLKPENILPTNILHINPEAEQGSVIWFTLEQRKQLYFANTLDIPNGIAYVPALIWKATLTELSLYAIVSSKRPKENTKLYHAPFFNMYKHGTVCMGTVNVDIKNSASIEEFIKTWEDYFFNSYFSHLLPNHNPINGDCEKLWKKLINSANPFPTEILIPTNTTVQNLIR